MKKNKINIHLINLTLFLCTISCTKNNETIEERIESHKFNTYSLTDSLKIIDSKIDSLIKIYSNK